MTSKQIQEYFAAFSPSSSTQQVICPPNVYLSFVKSLMPEGVILGAQNCFYEQQGAYTGEVSASMLKDLGVEYVIVGHSERRKMFFETDEVVAKKIVSAVQAGLVPILCVGEQLVERNAAKAVVRQQLEIALLSVDDQAKIVVAYEPVWAIGTGQTPNVEECAEMVETIRNFKKNTLVLYGGSVDENNYRGFLNFTDGLLVGGASLDPKKFCQICS